MNRLLLGSAPHWALAFAFAFTGALTGGCKREVAPPAEPSARVVSTRPVEQVTTASLVLRGVVRPAARVRLGFAFPGRLMTLYARVGDEVRAGQELASLEAHERTSRLRMTEADYQKSLRDYEDVERLTREGSFATRRLDDAKTLLDVTGNALGAAKAGLADSKLIAPTAGTIVERNAEIGDTVIPGVPILVLDRTSARIVRIGITSQSIDRIKVGTSVVLHADGGVEGRGSITTLATAPDASDGLYAAEIAPDPALARALRVGTLVTVTIETALPRPMARVSPESIFGRGGKYWAVVLEGNASTTTARVRSAEVWGRSGDALLVASGLASGERIVTEGPSFVSDGERVEVLP